MKRFKVLLLISLCSINSIAGFGQNVTRFLQIPSHSSGTFTKLKHKNKAIAGKQFKLTYETVPLRNTLRLINRNFKEIHTIKRKAGSTLELDISKATILQENFQREADQNFLASDTQVASMPISLFR